MKECDNCNGDGIDPSHEAALYYAEKGELSPCPKCEGKGTLDDTTQSIHIREH